MSSVYRSLFRRAWAVTRQAKHLWFFGILSALLTGGGEVNVLFHNLERVVRLGEWAPRVRVGEIGIIPWRLSSLLGLPAGMYVLGIITALVGLFLAYVSFIAQGALVKGIMRDRGKRLSLAEGMEEGKRYAGRLCALTVLYYAVTGIGWAVFALPPFLLYLAFGSVWWLTLFLLVAFVGLVPAAVLIMILYRLAVVVCVAEDRGYADAVKRAWQVGKAHWIVMGEFALLLAAGISAAALIGVSLMLLLAGVIFGPLVIFGYVFNAPLVFTASVSGGLLLFLAGVMFIGALVAVFQQAAWVMLYQRLRENPPLAKIVRFAVVLSLLLKRARA